MPLPVLAGLRARARSLWLGARHRRAVELEMAEEFRHHQELRAAELVRQGWGAAEAARQARLDFGSAELHKDAARAARGLHWLDGLRVSALDLRLGVRMLVKYPGLTVVGGLAMAFGIWVGAVTFELVRASAAPTVPLPEGDRLVKLALRDVQAGQPEGRALHDFVAWRETLRSVRELGAYRDAGRTLVTPDGDARPVDAAEITAAGFHAARVRPLLGRPLVESDERPDAPPVVVIGHGVWQARFRGDPAVLGRTVRLGETVATVVGVMPEGFAFPTSHEAWSPLRLRALDYPRRGGPEVTVFGRLAPGVTLAEAQAELTTLGTRAAAAWPETHRHLQPRVQPYASTFLALTPDELRWLMGINLFLVMLLVLACSNVALLMFARAASREGELTVRTALGAGRGRIVAQLFAEALVLGALAAAVGLAAAGYGLRWGMALLTLNLGKLPFWYADRLSATTLAYAAGLTLVGAAVAGVVPALKVTRGLGARLRQAAAGGGGLRFGGLWTAVIVAQVAVTVAFPVSTFVIQREMAATRSYDVGFAAHEFLAARVESSPPTAPGVAPESLWAAHRARTARSLETLRQRLAAEPGVAGVTFVDVLPRMYHPERRIEIDLAEPGETEERRLVTYAATASVDPSYFDVLERPVVAGRTFRPADVDADAPPVIVDQGFVGELLRGRNPVGMRLRFRPSPGEERAGAPPGPWLEVVGVARELGVAYRSGRAAGLYSPARPGAAARMHVAVHVRGDPRSLAPRLRAVAAEVDPTLRLSNVQGMDEVMNQGLWALSRLLRVTVVLSGAALLLSLAGIYAVLSFTVARRTREIGVRVALGASRRRVVAAIFRRPVAQVGVGVAAGGALVALAAFALPGLGTGLAPRQVALLAGYSLFMLAVCLLACVVPTRRALAVEPTEALREDG